MKANGFLFLFLGTMIFFSFALDARAETSHQTIGNITAIQKEVSVIHPGQLDVEMVSLGGSVLFKDFYETKREAKLKLLFDDDSILTLGENTRLQITENIYNPEEDQRITVLNLVNGSVRALVGKIFGGAGSKFEIHTPTAAAAARGTYFIVWKDKGPNATTGVVNIGKSGLVEVSNKDQKIPGSVHLEYNQFTMIEMGRPPTAAIQINLGLLTSLLIRTEVRDQVAKEIPKGMEAPGSDVSTEAITPPPAPSIGTVQPTVVETTSLEPAPVELATIPSVPPIIQQPGEIEMEPPSAGLGSTPVTVDIDFSDPIE